MFDLKDLKELPTPEEIEKLGNTAGTQLSPEQKTFFDE